MTVPVIDPVDPEGDPWVCAFCGYAAPVPHLARQCEQRHLQDDRPD